MKTIKQQRLDLLNETVSYYSEDINKRAIKDNFCYYYQADTGHKCAIGRHINYQDYLNNKLDEGFTVKEYYIFALLPEHIRRLNEDFLYEVQRLHDGEDYWDVNGLSDKGKYKVLCITNSYCQ